MFRSIKCGLTKCFLKRWKKCCETIDDRALKAHELAIHSQRMKKRSNDPSPGARVQCLSFRAHSSLFAFNVYVPFDGSTISLLLLNYSKILFKIAVDTRFKLYRCIHRQEILQILSVSTWTKFANICLGLKQSSQQIPICVYL